MREVGTIDKRAEELIPLNPITHIYGGTYNETLKPP